MFALSAQNRFEACSVRPRPFSVLIIRQEINTENIIELFLTMFKYFLCVFATHQTVQTEKKIPIPTSPIDCAGKPLPFVRPWLIKSN